jgi:hypothetical protein
MALSPRMSNALARAMLNNAVNTTLNEGLGDAIINVYTGSPPADCEAAATGTLLGTVVINTTPFGAATDLAPGARITANAIGSDIYAIAAGTAGYFRVYSTDAGNESSKLSCHIQGTAGEAADTTDMTLSRKAFVIGLSIQITAWTFDILET